MHTSRILAVRHKTHIRGPFHTRAARSGRSFPTPPPMVTSGGLALLDSEKLKALADSLQTQLQPVKEPSEPALTEVINVAMRACALAPGSEPQLTNSADVQEAIRGLKVDKAPRPNGIPNRTLNHLPLILVLFLVVLFNAIFQTQYFPPVGKTPACFTS